MEMEYLCSKCRRKCPIEEVRYIETQRGFQLICKKCAPDKWNLPGSKTKVTRY